MTTQRSYDAIRNDLIARAQDCIHYLAALVPQRTSGFESTFIDRVEFLKGKLETYDHAYEAFTECINLALDTLPTLEAISPEAFKVARKAIDRASLAHDKMTTPDRIHSSAELKTMARRGFVAFEELMEALHIDAINAIDLDDMGADQTRAVARIVDEYSKRNL